MYQREVLGLAEVRTAVEAALAEASKEPNRPQVIAIVDDRGDLIYFARMDGALPMFTDMAINKAYTAARMQRDTASFGDWLKEKGRDIAMWTDSQLTPTKGGMSIIKAGEGYLPLGTKKGKVLGGIGVSGRSGEEDEQTALAGLKAIKFA